MGYDMGAGHEADGQACAVVIVIVMAWLTVAGLCAVFFWG